MYNEAGELVRKRIIPAEGNEEVYQLTNTDNESKATLTSLDASYIARTITDNLGRKITDTLGDITKSYTYHVGEVTSEHKANDLNFGNATTQLVKKITYSDTRTIEYEYDNEERITKVTDSVEGTTVYTYDALGQLISEVKNGVTVNTMTYDDYGNITSKNGKSYTYANSYWKDLLTSYDGSSITYDEQGNPTNYMGTALVWEKGRQLKSFGTTSYKYNANGVRIFKSVGGTAHHYILDGTKILKETWGTNTIIPLYDNEESVCGIVYNGTTYYFTKNLQGDVISITNPSGTTLARYSYDAWGKCTITEDTTEEDIATVNPYRYRSYYYDSETGLYYLQSRYYDPEIGRFISGDRIEFLSTTGDIIGENLFTYCKNNCVNVIDELGYGGIESLLAALNSAIDILDKLIKTIGNSFNKDRKKLESSISLLTRKQKISLKNIKTIQNQSKSISKKLGWIGAGITFLSLVIGAVSAYNNGIQLDSVFFDLSIETFIAMIEIGAGKIFEFVAKFVPYIGLLLGIIGGWVISQLLKKFFTKKRVKRIKNKFYSFVKNGKITFNNWLKYAVKSLSA